MGMLWVSIYNLISWVIDSHDTLLYGHTQSLHVPDNPPNLRVVIIIFKKMPSSAASSVVVMTTSGATSYDKVETLGFQCHRSMLTRYRSHRKITDRCLTDVDPIAFAMWVVLFHTKTPGTRLSINMPSYQYRDPVLKIRRPRHRLIFNMRIPVPGKTVFTSETSPGLINRQAESKWENTVHTYTCTFLDQAAMCSVSNLITWWISL